MRFPDLGVILAYLVAITLFGARFRAGQKSLKDYFLGGRTAPWWAIGLSIVSAETSTLTIVGTPRLSFEGDLGFLQIVFGYLLARVAISVLLLPHYFRGEMFTAYELMRRRFGEHTRKVTASIFLVARALAEGVRVFAVSIVISIVLVEPLAERIANTPPNSQSWVAAHAGVADVASIVLIVCLTLFYTFEGGMTAVIWTDVVQMLLYVSGALISFVVILKKIDGGWAHVAQIASSVGKFQVLHFNWDFSIPFTFWAGLAGGCFLTTASHGTDQLMVQRLLSARSERESRTALFASWGVIFLQFCLFLFIGILLFVYYGDRGWRPPAQMDRIYPAFIWRELPVGVAGLTIAAILAAAMANLSAALNSLASTTIVDFYRPWANRRAVGNPPDEGRYVRLARLATVGWGAVLLGIGILARQWGSVLVAGLTIASLPFGALLGTFLLGVLTHRPGGRAAIAGVVGGLATITCVRFFTSIAWTWYVLIGASVTFGVGLLVGWVTARIWRREEIS